VTTGQPESNLELGALAPAQPASRAKRTWEWFWRGKALAEKKKVLRALSPRATVLAQRAHSCADLALNTGDLARNGEVARGALVPIEPLESLAHTSTSELYRQSAYWSLCALIATSDELAGTSYDQAVWDTLDENLLTAAAPGERAEALRASLRAGSFVYFAELPAQEQAAISDELRRLAESLLAKVDQPTHEVQRVLQQRALRLALILFAAVLLFLGLVWLRKVREARNDLTTGVAWRASSKLGSEGCAPPAQQCSESPHFFFHTEEEKDPWIEFDLDSARQMSGVIVDNRVDCCSERATPLTVEISDDHKHWKTVARQEAEFKTWHATFAPVKARWVRLRAHKVTFLHFVRVRISP
jgi:hypothetical protein